MPPDIYAAVAKDHLVLHALSIPAAAIEIGLGDSLRLSNKAPLELFVLIPAPRTFVLVLDIAAIERRRDALALFQTYPA